MSFETNSQTPTKDKPLPNSNFDSAIIEEVFNAFDSRLSGLRWVQNEEGTVFVTDSRLNPETVAEISINKTDASEVVIHDGTDFEKSFFDDMDRLDASRGSQSGIQD